MVVGRGKHSIYLLHHLDHKFLRILTWGDNLGLSGGSDVFTGVLIRGSEGSVTMEAKVIERVEDVMLLALKMEEEPHSKDCR